MLPAITPRITFSMRSLLSWMPSSSLRTQPRAAQSRKATDQSCLLPRLVAERHAHHQKRNTAHILRAKLLEPKPAPILQQVEVPASNRSVVVPCSPCSIVSHVAPQPVLCTRIGCRGGVQVD